MLKFAIYVSNHGYGHARRMAALAEEFIKFGIFVYIRSARPDFLFDNLEPAYYHKDDVICDVGVIHGDNLAVDLSATRSALFGLMSERLGIVEKEVEFLRNEKIDLILADIPWLAVEAGTYSNIPVFAISNFDWLYIYRHLFASDKSINPLLNTIFGLYQRVDHAFRLPFSTPVSMGSFIKSEKVGLLAACKSKHFNVREKYGLGKETLLLTCSFGGEGDMEFNLQNLCASFPGFVLTTKKTDGIPNHIQMDQESDFSDLIRESDVLLTKPGYSSFAEALQFCTYIMYQRRKGYPEDEILVRGLLRYPHKYELDDLDISKTRWQRIFQKMILPKPGDKCITNSNAKIATLIIQRFSQLRYSGKKLRSIFDVGSNNINYALCEEGQAVPIHTAQVTTGLGRKFTLLENNLVSVPGKSIRDFKRNASILLKYDKNIVSTKQVIATGIHRKLESASEISEWFAKVHKIPYKILSENEEAELAWLAAKELIPQGESAVIVDIGGFSTELIYVHSQQERVQTSIPLGLLILRDALNRDMDTESIIKSALDRINIVKPHKMITIGLTASFLARKLSKAASFLPEKIHKTRIQKYDLVDLEHSLNQGELQTINRNLMAFPEKEILKLSVQYFRLLLDKYGTQEFIVCYYGISAGYNFWPKRKKIKNQIVGRSK